jgi:5'(3')-deoxyribonucleotidase
MVDQKAKKMQLMWIEHMTFRSSVWRSPNWAKAAFPFLEDIYVRLNHKKFHRTADILVSLIIDDLDNWMWKKLTDTSY